MCQDLFLMYLHTQHRGFVFFLKWQSIVFFFFLKNVRAYCYLELLSTKYINSLSVIGETFSSVQYWLLYENVV